ncbi:hypothetical protein MMC11_008347 [Xylographa trunciseda]|nr:hypothetical protein [Xylographa trunciseda]
MLTQCCHSETFICGLKCRLHLRKRVQALGVFNNASQLPTWSLNAKGLSRGEKRSLEEDSSESTTGKRRCGRLTFLPGTFRPLIVLDDDVGSDYRGIPRPLLLKGKSTFQPVLIGDEGTTKSAKCSVAPNAAEHILVPPFVPGAIFKDIGQKHHNDHKISRRRDLGDHNFEAAKQDDGRQLAVREPHDSPLMPEVGSGVDAGQDSGSGSWLAEQKHDTVVVIPKVPKDNLSVKDRKRFFIETPTAALAGAMTKWVSETYEILDPQRSDTECWLHPKPPPPRRQTGRAYGSIPKRFHWKDENSSHTLSVNFGVVALVVESSLTEAQMRGYINEGWHLSHLCGNWTCCNWRHFTVEAGSINIRRNSCFMHRYGCTHNPPCMKHLKRRLTFATSPSSGLPLSEEVPIVSPEETTKNLDETVSSWLSCVLRSQSLP